MGLDQFLNRKTYVQNWDHNPKDTHYEIIIKRGGKEVKHIDTDKITNIEEEIIYWRKANHIHKWFVDNVQDGEDDCKEYYVTREQLEELRDLCLKVLNLKKEIESKQTSKQNSDIYDTIDSLEEGSEFDSLLPCQSGFFFGGVHYDEYYFDSTQRTYDELSKVLEKKDTEGDFYYTSSW